MKYKQMKHNQTAKSIMYDFKDDSWDFSGVDDMDKEQAEEWITNWRKLRKYEMEKGLVPTMYPIIETHIVDTKEQAESNPPRPQHLQQYEAENLAFAYLIDKFELYELTIKN